VSSYRTQFNSSRSVAVSNDLVLGGEQTQQENTIISTSQPDITLSERQERIRDRLNTLKDLFEEEEL
jgi:hypothetical protein